MHGDTDDDNDLMIYDRQYMYTHQRPTVSISKSTNHIYYDNTNSVHEVSHNKSLSTLQVSYNIGIYTL